ncbi:hypothetical protein Vqi01_31100 [Micromonospora qiuiae]|uniref:Uncharacterized protein n=1 Tax=Micromonospora qiuiae TaxID=502268 RepID=A0ABQ4JCV3_9ACTN|nr:hypothetical protein Vqi01_31100 [Micromonospora qiuiae]
MLMVSAIVGLLGALVAGVGAYLPTNRYQATATTVPCRRVVCIPVLKASTVVDALRAKGHPCEQERDRYWKCELVVGTITFETTIDEVEGLISDVSVLVARPADEEPTEAVMDYLLWLAALPYTADEALTEEVNNWVIDRIEANEDTEAEIGGYNYTVTTSSPGSIRLRISGALR